MDINKVILMGNMGKEPEFHEFSSGDRVGKFSVATNVSWQKDGEWKSKTTWHNVECFNEFLNKRLEKLGKGSKVYLEGSTKVDEYEKDGVTMRANKVEIPKFGGEFFQVTKGEESQAAPAQAPAPAPVVDNDFNDEIPW
jgi:single-strand DNA-binding protein